MFDLKKLLSNKYKSESFVEFIKEIYKNTLNYDVFNIENEINCKINLIGSPVKTRHCPKLSS